ncbi:1,4-alpha-glucan branching protein GlgB [Anaerotignum sp. MB30-C6]|uniref:1,4-alpha-glucan branching protein GlgB n=1 Tax=Anaerotignum sp. MB30-C6 TaxID=3070814 RepID=UPI0027DDFF15|nr:1,4-alpha-glucan branching protein GlgB [Anaerotignum sp. MB30-C6]WMI81409.1 1,4-alpha-glucan branching protein GlgB [Anaerotignum sp. MB30-C6]
MHEIHIDGETAIVVRAFLPSAQRIYVIDMRDENNNKKYAMTKIHEDGFFEVLIWDSEWFPYMLAFTDYGGNSWKSYDAYSYLSTISEYDRYLFGAGNHYEIYEKMGGRLISHGGTKGGAFTVWAPNAKSVSVIGNFNQWDTRRNPMRRLGISGVWELFIPGLMENDQYKFHVVQCDGTPVDKADPYGRYAQVRPETASVLYDAKKYKWKDKRWVTGKSKKNPYTSPMNVYEVHLGSWKRVPEEGNRFLSYTELADKLVPYVKDMGYNYIELLPVQEHPFDGSWGYQLTGYFAPTSRFGTPDEFKHFVDTCHNHGIGVILDWVPAHFPKDSFGLGRFDGTALYEHADPRRGEHRQWGTYMFNYGRKEVSNFLISNALFWLKEYHIDGLRVDAVASMLYLDFGKEAGEWLPNQYGGSENLEAVEFLKHMNSIVKEREPHALMIAEESTSWPGVTKDPKEGGLGFHLKWNMGWMNDFLFYIKNDPLFRRNHHNRLTFGMAYHYSENFMLVLSHDEVVHEKSAMIGKMPGDDWQRFANLRLSYGFMYGHPGKKLLFMGGEFGQYQEWCESRSLDWHLLQYADHQQMQAYVQALNQLYLEKEAFWKEDFDSHGFQWIDCDDKDSSIVSFIRRSEDEEIYCICNFTPVLHHAFRIGVPEKGTYKEIFNSDRNVFGGSGVENTKKISSEETPWNHFSQSIVVKIPPLSIIILEQAKEREKKSTKKI